MLIVNTDYITGKKLETLSLVKGSTVQCKNVGKDILSGFKNLVGGEMTAYTEMMDEARAIATRPPIIMADEPTGALDSKTGRHVLEILRELYREGTTILLITHDDGIAATARREVRLSDGKIISDQTQEVDWE